MFKPKQLYQKTFLCAALAISALLASSSGWAAKREFNMTIEEVQIQVAPDLKYQVFAFDGQVPGPLIHVQEGDDVTVHVTNGYWPGQNAV